MLNKLAVFIDGPNLHYTSKTLGFEIDFIRLIKQVETRGYIVRAYYYALIFGEPGLSLQRPLLDWLGYNGFQVREKPASDFDDGAGRRKYKRNLAIELAVDAIEIAPHVNQVFVFSGDGNLRRLIEFLQARGIYVTVVSTLRSQTSTVADELRRQADEFLEIETWRSSIERLPVLRDTPKELSAPRN